MQTLEVQTVTVDLDGGRRLRVSRYTDPESGRSVLALGKAWTHDLVSFPTEGPDVLTLPAACTADLVAALEALDE